MLRRGLVIAAIALSLVAHCTGDPFEGCPPDLFVGTTCNHEGLRCSPSSGACGAVGAFVCTKGSFVFETDSNATCAQAGLVCPFPGTECGACTCDGHTFHCAENCCVCDSGPPQPSCPSPLVVSAGVPCQGDLRCASLDHCDGGASAACACTSGKWTCSCVASPTVIISNEGSPEGVAVDATYVYWTAFDSALVRRAPQSGGPVETLATTQSHPYALALDALNAYWTTVNDNPNALQAVAKDGGAPVTLVSTSEPSPEAIAVDIANLYWGTFDGVHEALLDGGSPATLFAAQGHVNALAVDTSNVYAATEYGIFAVPIGGGARVTLSSDPAEGIAVDAANVYWAGANNVIELSLATKVTTVIAPLAASAIAVDATSVYWTEPTHGTIMKAPIGGGAPIILALGEVAPKKIAVGGANVFWTTTDDAVKSAPK